MKKITIYTISYYGPKNQIETLDVEANDVIIIQGAEHDLVCWIKGKRSVFAIPYRLLISTRVLPQLKAVKTPKAKNSKLSLCS